MPLLIPRIINLTTYSQRTLKYTARSVVPVVANCMFPFQQAHASSRATECRSLYYKVDRSDHYTAPSFASRGASQHQIGNDRIASAACLPTPGSAYNPAMNGTVTGQLQVSRHTLAFTFGEPD